MEQEKNNTKEPIPEKEAFKTKLLRWLYIHLKIIIKMIVQYLSKKNENKESND